MFDVGKIVRETSEFFLGTAPNRATPEHLAQLLTQLRELTEGLQLARLQQAAGVRAGVNVETWSDDLDAWKQRLSSYEQAVAVAPPGDRAAVQHAVSAPLLLGWYTAGMPGIVNPNTQSVADVATPYILANQLELERQWYNARAGLLFKDLFDNATRPIKQTFPWMLLAAGGGVAWYVMRKRGS